MTGQELYEAVRIEGLWESWDDMDGKQRDFYNGRARDLKDDSEVAALVESIERGPCPPGRVDLVEFELQCLRENLRAVAANLEQLAPSEVLRGRGNEVGAMQLQVSLLQAAARGLAVKP